MRMEDPLKQLIAGSWDREAFAGVFREQQEFSLLQEQIGRLVNAGKIDETIALINDRVEKSKSESNKIQLKFFKYQILLGERDPRVVDALNELAKAFEGQPSQQARFAYFAWQVQQRGGEIEGLTDAALKIAQAAVESNSEDPRALDVLARLTHAKGDLDKAIEFEEKAVKQAPSRLKVVFEKYLKELQKEKDGSDEKDEDEDQENDEDGDED